MNALYIPTCPSKHTCMQAELAYDAGGIDEQEHARDWRLPWNLRSVPDTALDYSPHVKGQRQRMKADGTKGRIANRGGFDGQVKKVWEASQHNYRFSVQNPEGQPLHVCAYSVACNVWRVRPRACSVVCVLSCLHSVVCKRVAVATPNPFMFTMSVFSDTYALFADARALERPHELGKEERLRGVQEGAERLGRPGVGRRPQRSHR